MPFATESMRRARGSGRGATLALLIVTLILSSPLSAVASDSRGTATAAASDERTERRAQLVQKFDEARRGEDEARQAEREAKIELDNFVVRHFENHRTHIAPMAPERTPRPAEQSAASREWQQINQQLQDTLHERDQLLRRFTSVHPEITNAEQRIATLNDRLAALGRPGEIAEDSPPNQDVDPAVPATPHDAALEQQQHQEFGVQYEKLVERWQTAHKNLLLAIAGNEAAATRLAEFDAAEPQLRAAKEAPAELPAEIHAGTMQQGGSQPLALAALLIALAVAALAAVRLARSDSVFSGIDDVAAALALPVVGVIPATASVSGVERAPQRPLLNQARRVGEFVLAFLVFTFIVYAVLNPGLIWQFCASPLDAFRQAGGGQ